MADKIRWANRDPGEKFSMMMMLLLGAVWLVGGAFLAAKLLLEGTVLMQRLNGAGLMLLDVVLFLRAVRWWRASNAR
jgi:hypothetical protein